MKKGALPMLTRRALMRSTALIPVVAAAGCAGLAQAVVLAPQIASYIQVIAEAAQAAAPFIEGLTNLSANVRSTINTALNDINSVAAGIASATSVTVGALVQKLGSGVGTLAGLLSGNALVPDVVNSFISSALALVPTVEQAVGISAAPAAPATPTARMAARITPEQAYANLARIAAIRRR